MGVAGVMVLEEERGRQKALGEQKKLNIDGGGGGNISRRPSSRAAFPPAVLGPARLD